MALESLAAAEWAAREALLRDLPLTLVRAGPRPLPRTHPSGIDAPAGHENHPLDSAVRELLGGFPELHAYRCAEPGLRATLCSRRPGSPGCWFSGRAGSAASPDS